MGVRVHGVHVVWCGGAMRGCGRAQACSRHEGSCRRSLWGPRCCCASVVVQCWAQARPAHPLCLTAAACAVSMHAHPTRPRCSASRTPQRHSVWCVHWTPHARDVLAAWGDDTAHPALPYHQLLWPPTLSAPRLAPSPRSPLLVPSSLCLLKPLAHLHSHAAVHVSTHTWCGDPRLQHPLLSDDVRRTPRRWLGHCCCNVRGAAEMCLLGARAWPTQQHRRGC